MRQDKAIVTYNAHVMGEAQRVNSQFSKVRIRVCYEGLNRHDEVISKETLTRMAENSLRNVPIVGHYLPDVNNFGGHDMALEFEGNELKLKNLTQAYGVVPESTDFTWETVTEKNGITQHEYLVCDGILWTGRYPEECNCILDNGMNQSMELCVSQWGESADGHDEVLDGEFAALCILGKDSDPEVNVEPCYEKAGIESYSLNDAVAELVQAYRASLEEPEVVATEDEDQTEEMSMDEPEAEAEVEEAETEKVVVESEEAEDDETVNESEVEEPEESTAVEECDAQAEQTIEALAADGTMECSIVTLEYRTDGTGTCTVEGTTSAAIDYQALYGEAADQNEELMAENARLTEELGSISAEVEELRAYRRAIEAAQIESELREEFSDLDGDEEFEEIVRAGLSVETRESTFEKCYALRGKKNKPQNKNYQYQGVKVPLVRAEGDKKLYGGLVDEYRARHNK